MEQILIYEKMYDIVSGNQTQSGKTIIFHKNTFCACCQKNPQIADMNHCDQLEHMEFLEFVYAVCLNRLIDKRALEYWSNEVVRHPETYRKKLIFRLLTSSEFIDLGKKIINNPYEIRFLNQKKVFFIFWNRCISKTALFLRKNNWLSELWHKIPLDVREKIIYAIYK